MDGVFHRKYKRVLEILPDVAICADGNLVLVGGTALALFYLKHRVSVDLDFVPIAGDEVRHKERLKGCLSKKGYRTVAGAFQNQFVVQFEDTGIKVEIFAPEYKIRKVAGHVFGGALVKVASLGDIYRMKLLAYADRREARDLFDIFCMPAASRAAGGTVKKLILKYGAPKNAGEILCMASNPGDAAAFQKEISDAAP